MNNSVNEWVRLKEEYLEQIRKNLSSIDPESREQIVEDVDSHLQQRFDELVPDQRTEGQYRQMISEMGPAESYLQHLHQEEPAFVVKSKSRLLPVGLTLLVGLLVLLGPYFYETFLNSQRISTVRATQGWQLFQTGQFEEAENLFREAIKKDSQNASAWNGLGWCFFNLGDSEKAKETFEHGVQIDDEVPGMWNGLGYISYSRKEYDQAIEHWKTAIEISSAATASYSGLAKLYLELKQYDLAAEIYRKWLDFNPEDSQAKSGLARALRGGGK